MDGYTFFSKIYFEVKTVFAYHKNLCYILKLRMLCRMGIKNGSYAHGGSMCLLVIFTIDSIRTLHKVQDFFNGS